MNFADEQDTSDQGTGTRVGARARGLLGRDPGAPHITFAAFLAFVLSVVL